MDVKKNKVNDFLSQNKTQFIIPVYQRNYDWAKTHCKQLLDDILKAGKGEKVHAHFIGSIVHVLDGAYISSGTTQLIIIDGQ